MDDEIQINIAYDHNYYTAECKEIGLTVVAPTRYDCISGVFGELNILCRTYKNDPEHLHFLKLKAIHFVGDE